MHLPYFMTLKAPSNLQGNPKSTSNSNQSDTWVRISRLLLKKYASLLTWKSLQKAGNQYQGAIDHERKRQGWFGAPIITKVINGCC